MPTAMLTNLLSSLFQFPLYVQISPDRITVRNPKTGEQISELPELAIATTPKFRILATGDKARAALAEPNVKIVNPFAHPRSMVSDFTAAEQLIRFLIARMSKRGLFSITPSVVMHPLGDPAGGFTQVEARAFREMALGAGARSAKVWHGRPLTDHELLSGQFPASGKQLD